MHYAYFLQNHMAERIWVEINSRVNYPLKSCLRDMEEVGDINMDDPAHKFCTSWFTIRVANVGTTAAVKSWNEHRIPSKHAKDNNNNINSSHVLIQQRREYQMF